MSFLLIRIIRLYQIATPKKYRGKCRYIPTCSDYAILSIRKYGIWEGIKVFQKRFARCCPPYGGEDYP